MLAQPDRPRAGYLPLALAIGAVAAFWIARRGSGGTDLRPIAKLRDALSKPPPSVTTPRHDPLAAQLTHADDRVDPSRWVMPPQAGVFPEIRIGQRWHSTAWLLPIGFVGLVGAIAVSQSIRETPKGQAFIRRYPGTAHNAPSVDSGFPPWLRWQHFFNLFLMTFIIRSGVQILADHPRLYWNRDCTPGTEWFRFQRPVPRDGLWTSKDDAVTLPKWLGIPGLRHTIGLARWWHFSVNLLWVLNGIVAYVNLFRTDQWKRLVPQTWGVFPNALSTAIQYASLKFPVDESWSRYNGLQQLTYFITVFVAAPIAIATGLMQGPAISNKLGIVGRIVHRQSARSMHFLSLSWFLFFIPTHIAMVFVTGLRAKLNHMFAGRKDKSRAGYLPFAVAMGVVAGSWWAASPLSLRHARKVQKTGSFLIGWLKGLAEWWDPNSQLTEKDISPFFWPNGTLPRSDEYDALVANGFANYRLRVGGLVETPREFTLAQIKGMPKQEQITTHFCIQGWSGVAKWGGVPMRHIMELVKPTRDARYVVFYSFGEGSEGGRYYDVHKLRNMYHQLTILAYEMNGEGVSVLHGAPLRLRCENELGFKMVKWISAIEFVHDFADLGGGRGGYHEDHEFYGYRVPI